MFLATQDIDEPEGAFWSDDFWTGFLAMMARNRYNFLDIHGPCDAVTLDFPNGFSYFGSRPGSSREKHGALSANHLDGDAAWNQSGLYELCSISAHWPMEDAPVRQRSALGSRAPEVPARLPGRAIYASGRDRFPKRRS